jgi:hypothetical protein
MRGAHSHLVGLVAGVSLAFATAAVADTNVLSSNWDVIQTTGGVVGVLRAGSPWAGSAALAAQSSIVDGIFVPENQTWNTGSWWWDEDPSVNASPVVTTIHLNSTFTFDHFVVQADDNDSYLLEWWDGASWQTAWNIPAVNTFGLVTRDSGALGPFTTDFLRFSAASGDNYYAVSEIQGFVAEVPEPATWAMMITGFAFAGAMLRRRRTLAAA